MKITTARTNQSVTRHFEITEQQPIVPMAYSQAGRKVRIERGSIEYTWQDGEWVAHSDWSINLNGVILLKNGGDSKNSHTRHPGRTSWRPGSPWKPEFEWIQPIIDLLRPVGALSLTEVKPDEA